MKTDGQVDRGEVVSPEQAADQHAEPGQGIQGGRVPVSQVRQAQVLVKIVQGDLSVQQGAGVVDKIGQILVPVVILQKEIRITPFEENQKQGHDDNQPGQNPAICLPVQFVCLVSEHHCLRVSVNLHHA